MTLDNPTAAPGAASELPGAPLDGIELAAQGAAEHLLAAPAEVSPSGARSTPALSPPPALEQAPEAAPVLEPSGERSAQKRALPGTCGRRLGDPAARGQRRSGVHRAIKEQPQGRTASASRLLWSALLAVQSSKESLNEAGASLLFYAHTTPRYSTGGSSGRWAP
jgi:hypothetical protein